MHSPQAQVDEAHRVLGIPHPERFSPLRGALAELRVRLIREEADEFADAALAGDDAGMVDALCDLLYVTYGAAVSMGVDLEPFFDAVHRANLLKAGGPVREDGKRLKPAGWRHPDIAAMIEEYRSLEAGIRPPRRVYLAARYERRQELCRYRDELEALGYEVTSRWLSGAHSVECFDDRNGALARFGSEDLEDVGSADVIVAFTEHPDPDPNRGGRHVELGCALACGKRAILVGPRENIFCWLPQMEVYAMWPEARAALAAEIKEVA